VAAMDHKAPKSQSRSSGVHDGTPEVPNPSRLTLARKRRGYKKTKLADLAKLDLRAVTAFEAGEYPPSSQTLSRIASVLDFPVAFFYGDDLDEPSLDSGSFRSMSKMTASQRDMALSQAALGLQFMGWIEGRFELPETDLPDLSREPNPEAAAESLRRAWGLGALSIRNMIHLLEAKGVRVLSLAVDAREVDAFSMWKGARPFVFLNTYKSTEHSRFDAAHELGHLVLHKHGPPQGREAEKQANAFASAFLMPRGSVLANVPRFPTYSTLVQLKKVWTTSVSALSYRLHELSVLSDWQYRGLCIEIAKRGRDTEPDEAPRETSLVLPRVLAALYADGFSRARIAHALCLTASELEQLIFGLAMTGIEGGRQQSSRQSRTLLERVK
jgi:Zn-dependent peptidase ImmA (M78 family)/DNA-binding XRE family transcriptional regulator